MTEKREWLVRCTFEEDEMAVCAIGVERGEVAVCAPDHTYFMLHPDQFDEFRESLAQAKVRADAERAARRAS